MPERTESRLVELESRITEQERVIEQLGEVIIEQGAGLEDLAGEVRRLADSLRGSGGESSPAESEPPPPHY